MGRRSPAGERGGAVRERAVNVGASYPVRAQVLLCEFSARG